MPNGWVLIAAAAAVIVGLAIIRKLLGLIVLLALVAVLVLLPGPRDALGTAWTSRAGARAGAAWARP